MPVSSVVRSIVQPVARGVVGVGGAASLTFLDADDTAYVVPLQFFDADDTSHTITNAFLDADDTVYLI